jgi:predicted DNA-binding protein
VPTIPGYSNSESLTVPDNTPSQPFKDVYIYLSAIPHADIRATVENLFKGEGYTMRGSKMKAIVLRLPEEMVEAIDDVRHELRMNRTAWIRKAIRAQIENSKRYELPLFKDAALRRALQP